MTPKKEVLKQCGSKLSKRDGYCTLPAGWGTQHPGYGKCIKHLGRTRSLRLAASKEEALERAKSIADEIEINPLDAMLWCVRLSAGAVAYYRDLLGAADAMDENQLDPDLVELIEAGVGKAYGDERDRLVRTSAACIGAGLAERQVALAERQGELVAEVLQAVLGELGLSPAKQREARALAAKHLLAIPAQAREAG